MMVRLAFAISTAIGGEILLLDEILGAGDITFMKKARARIENLISDAHILCLPPTTCRRFARCAIACS
jgi:lipopolysaccharide transport system ATP-binding protein